MATIQQSAEAEQIGNALGFEGTIVKTGYLTKRAKKSGSNWKRRYFVLTGSSLVYYETHKKKDEPKGDLLLTVDCDVRDVDEPKYPHCFEIISAFETLRIAANSLQEAEEWKSAIVQLVSNIGSTTRGFLNLQLKSLFGGKSWIRKFFVLHASAITYHEDHTKTYKKQGEMRLTSMTRVTHHPGLLLELTTNDKTLTLQMKTEEERIMWQAAIIEVLSKLASRDDLASKRGLENDEKIILNGKLATQQNKASAHWSQFYYALTSSALYQAEEEHSAEALNVFLLEPSCSVYPTSLHPNAFELVTSHTVLHLYASNKTDSQSWIAALRKVISNSTGLNSDPLLNAAKRIQISEYSVTYHTKRKLSIVLERAAEWAIVKSAKDPESNITEGSALIRVNEASTILAKYDETIRMLTDWKPPLVLTFALAPEKRGWLAKQARGRRGSAKNWKLRYFVLQAGKLAYYTDTKESPATMKDSILLMGCAVSLISRDDSGYNFCFRVNFGVGDIIMQATTLEEMIEWASTLYHAIAIANGGGYLLDGERRRVHAEREAVKRVVEFPGLRNEAGIAGLNRDAAMLKAQEAAGALALAESDDELKRLSVGSSFEQKRVTKREAEEMACQPIPTAWVTETAYTSAIMRVEESLADSSTTPRVEKITHREFEGCLSQMARQADELHEGAVIDLTQAESHRTMDTAVSRVEGLDCKASDPTMFAAPGTLCRQDTDSVNAGDDHAVTTKRVVDASEHEVDSPTQIFERVEETLWAPLTDAELENAYSVVESEKDYINPMQFVSLLRAVGVSDRGNLKFDLDLFHYFDTMGTGKLTKSEFVIGFQNYFSTFGLDDPCVPQSSVPLLYRP